MNMSASLMKDYLSLQFFSPIILNYLSYNIFLEHAAISTCNSSSHIRALLIQSFLLLEKR